MTANPSQLGAGVPGTLGVIAKPVADSELRAAIRYAVACHREHMDAEPPARLQLFMMPDGDPGRDATGGPAWVRDSAMWPQYLAVALLARGHLREAFAADERLLLQPSASPWSGSR